MFWYAFGSALFIALILALLFSSIFNNRGPWDSFWVFTVILFLGIWAAGLWFNPVGPLWYGVAWVDLLLIGIFLALLLGAAGEAGRRYRDYPDDREVDIVSASKNEPGAIALFGVFFWLFLLSLVLIIALALINLL